MDTKKVVIEDRNHPKEWELEEAAIVLKQGGLVAFPTETVYGLGADGLRKEAAAKIYQAKARPSDNPLIIHIGRKEDVAHLVSSVSEDATVLMNHFWPGPLTLVFKKAKQVPYETTGGLDTVGVRMPNDPIALMLIQMSGVFVAAPSANVSGRPSPTMAEHVIEDLDGAIPLIVDGGLSSIGLESTIVDVSEGNVMILRPGAITKGMMEDVLGKEVWLDPALFHSYLESQKPKAPGMKYRHYAPKANLSLVKGEEARVVDYINEKVQMLEKQGLKVGIICMEETKTQYVSGTKKVLGKKISQEMIARNLYKVLREFDGLCVDAIYSESFEEDGICMAIMNRLIKASGYQIINV